MLLFVIYVDDGILASKNKDEIDHTITDIQLTGYEIEDQGDLNDYLGVNVEKLPDRCIKISQLHLIDQILAMANLPSQSAGTKQVPAPSGNFADT